MLYFSHSVGGTGVGTGSMKPTFGLRVQQIRQGANSGDPAEQGDSMQHRELINWQVDGRSNLRLSESRLKLGNKLTFDFGNKRFGSPSNRSAMQLAAAPSLRNPLPLPTRGFASRGLPANFGANPASNAASSARENSNLHELASAAMAAITPTRFTAAQRQMAQRQGGLLAIASAQRMQSVGALR